MCGNLSAPAPEGWSGLVVCDILPKHISSVTDILLNMHKTDAGEKRKILRRKAGELEKHAKKLGTIPNMQPAARIRQDEADRLKSEAEAVKREARLEDLNVFVQERVRGKEKKVEAYWYASWREDGTTKNVYLGSCKKMDEESAMKKARMMKAAALGI